MPNRPARCTQAELNRAVKAVSNAGGKAAIEVTPDGIIRIIFGDTEGTTPTDTVDKDWKL